MKKQVFVAVLWVISLSAHAQYFKFYLNADGANADSSKATTYIVYRQIADTAFFAKQYQMDGKILFAGIYKDKSLTVLNGQVFYYQKATILSKEKYPKDIPNYIYLTGQYIDGIKNGEWTEFYPDGNKKELNTYRNGKLNGLHELYGDETLPITVKGRYNEDLKQGDWIQTSKSGHTIRVESFKDGKLTNTVLSPSAYIGAVPPPGFNKFVIRNIKDLVTTDTYVNIVIQCTITTEGKLKNPHYSYSGANPNLLSKLLTILPNSLPWKPAYINSPEHVTEDNNMVIINIKDGEISVSSNSNASALYYQITH
jgi:hypothetical protein